MPLISCRRDQTGGRPAFVPFGNSGSSTAHCSSVRSPRAMNHDHSSLKIHFRHTASCHFFPTHRRNCRTPRLPLWRANEADSFVDAGRRSRPNCRTASRPDGHGPSSPARLTRRLRLRLYPRLLHQPGPGGEAERLRRRLALPLPRLLRRTDRRGGPRRLLTAPGGGRYVRRPDRCALHCPGGYQVTGSVTGPRMSTSFCQGTSAGSTASLRSGRRVSSVVSSSSASMRASSGATQWWGP